MDPCIILCFVFLFLAALWFLHRQGLMSSIRSAGICILLSVLSLLLRLSVFDYQTLDYQNFLAQWVDYFRQNGGFHALSHQIGNYNIPYLYFLALFSYLPVSDLYLIKLLSVVFDFLLAVGCTLLVKKLSGSRMRMTFLFFAVLLWPTVFLNGSLWAQCDSSYTALILLGIFCAMDDRPVLSMVFAALAFGFKLQAVFILPVYAVFWMQGKFKLRHFLVFPICYLLLVLPAVFMGRPLWETLTLYFNQTGSIGSGLNYNSPSVFSFFQYTLPESLYNTACRLGIAAAFLFMFSVLALCYANRKKLTNHVVLALALLFSIGIPFLLPHMHDRYFFAADILSLTMGILSPVFLPVALCTEFASLLGYHAYLKMRFLLLMDKGAWALTVSLAITLAYILHAFFSPRSRKKNS